MQTFAENPGEDLRDAAHAAVDKPTITAEQINSLIEAIEDLHDLCLMAIGLFCATRTSETFGLQWKSYQQDKLIIQTTAFEGRLYHRVKMRPAGVLCRFRRTFDRP